MNLKSFIESILCKSPRFYLLIRHLCKSSDWEKDCFINTIQRGWIIIEIGANEGYYTKLFSKLIDKNGTLHAFEPINETFQILKSNLENSYNHINLHNLGVSSNNRESIFFVPKNDSGQSSLRRHNSISWKNREIMPVKCKVVKLDDFEPISKIHKINFIKIDVEGAELPSLQGAENILRKHKPILFIEGCRAWMKSFHYTPKEMDTFLIGLGYTTFKVIHKAPFIIKSIDSFMQSKGEEESFNFLIS